MPNSKQVGDETEAAVISTMVGSGHSVSLPFGDNDKYDLLVDDGSRIHRLQCKTGWKTETGTIRFNTHSQTTRSGTYHEDTYHEEIDAFVVRFPPTETLYWIAIEDATDQKMELRYEAEIDHPSINWAEDYEFDGEIP